MDMLNKKYKTFQIFFQQTTMAQVYLCNKPACSTHVSQNLKYKKKKDAKTIVLMTKSYYVVAGAFLRGGSVWRDMGEGEWNLPEILPPTGASLSLPF